MDKDIQVFAFVSKVQEITDILQGTLYEDMIYRIYEKKRYISGGIQIMGLLLRNLITCRLFLNFMRCKAGNEGYLW